MKPLHDYILLKELDAETTTPSGLALPESVAKQATRGVVIAVGLGRFGKDGYRVPSDLMAGDIVVYQKFTDYKFELDGEKYLLLKEKDILAVYAHSDN